METEKYTVVSDFENSVYARYRTITACHARVIVLAFLPLVYIGFFIIISDPNCFQKIVAHGLDNITKVRRFLEPCIVIVAALVYPFICYLALSERRWTKKKFDHDVKALKINERRDLAASLSIFGRTYYRYCASLEMDGKQMVITDRVKGLINGPLDIKEVGTRPKRCYVELNLSINQITAVWVAKDLIVIRFCWGTSYQQAWDVILNRSNFTQGSSDEFVAYLKDYLEFRPIVYKYDQYIGHEDQATLGNTSTNYLEQPYYNTKQREVKVFKVHWGPFGKRKRR